MLKRHIGKYIAYMFLLVTAYTTVGGDKDFAGNITKSAVGYFPTAVWNPYIAEYANDQPINVLADGEEIEEHTHLLYMNDDLFLMAGKGSIQEIFQCAVHEYEDGDVLIEKQDASIRVSLNDGSVTVNGEIQSFGTEIVTDRDNWLLPVEQIAGWLGFDWEWNASRNQLSVLSADSDRDGLPRRYDYRERDKKTTVKNQGSLGTCWALASLTALETTMRPLEAQEFAADHMSIHNGFTLDQNAGGDYTMSMAYLTAWMGPVLEADDPYGDGVSPDNLEAVKHVQEVQLPAEKDFQSIKQCIYKYGAVQSSIYMALENPNSESRYYNKEAYAYCYTGQSESNHDVVIIGWDDDFSRENFGEGVEEDGAFICQNSWGEEFGEDGVFYISYEDTRLGIHNAVYTLVEDTDNYDSIYQSDLCGWIGQIGYGSEKAYFANVYTAESEEMLEAVGFYATGANTEYSIYIIRDFEDEESFKEKEFLQNGKLGNAGYYTINLQEAIALSQGEDFAVVIKIKTPDIVHPIAIEYQADENSQSVDLSDGRGYISYRGDSWESSEDVHECNVCLKAYTSVR